MTELREVRPQDRELLWNINQKYLYEMTNFYDDPMDENGNFHYGYFEAYFTDPARKAYFIYSDDRLCGFMMINPYSFLKEKPDHVMAEFTIFPTYRRKHLASEVVKLLFNRYKGNWEIKYNEKNIPARTLWNKVTEPYHPEHVRYSDEETVLKFKVD